MKTLWLVLGILFLWTMQAQATVVETNEWNNKTQAGWFYSNTSPLLLPIIDVAPAGGSSPSGGFAIRGTMPAGTYTLSKGMGTSSFESLAARGITNEIYMGTWVKFSVPFQFHPIGTKVFFPMTVRDPVPGAGRDNFVWNILPGGTGFFGTAQLNSCSAGYCSYNVFPTAGTITPGIWYWFETHLRLNTFSGATPNTDGVIELWVNDVQKLSLSNKIIVTIDTPMGTSQLSPIWGGGCNPATQGSACTVNQEQSIWYDHTIISTSRIFMPTSSPSDLIRPTTPTNLTASASGGNQITLNWTASTDTGGSNLAGYNIKRCTPSACTPTAVYTTVGVVTSYVDMGVTPGVGYSYTINAFDGASPANQSDYTAAVSATTTGTFRTTLATDDFNRADGSDLSSSWDAVVATGRSACKLVSQRYLPTTLNVECHEAYNAVTPPNDQWCQVTVSVLTGAQAAEFGCSLRMATPPVDTHYTFFANVNSTNKAGIVEYTDPDGAGATAGVGVLLVGNTTQVWGVGDKIRGEAEGTALRLYRIPANGSAEILLLETTDATLTSGRAGVYEFMATAGTLTNIQGDDFAMGGFSATDPTGTTTTAVQSASDRNDASATTIAKAYPSTPTAGNFDWGCVAWDLAGASTATVAGSSSGAWTKAIEVDRTGDEAIALFYKANIAGGADTVTATFTPAAAGRRIAIHEVAGVKTASPLDQTAGQTQDLAATTTDAVTSGALTPTEARELITGCTMALTTQVMTVSPGTGFTQRQNTASIGTGQLVSEDMQWPTATATAATFTLGTSKNMETVAASFKVTTAVVTVPKITGLVLDATGATVSWSGPPISTRIYDDRESITEPLTSPNYSAVTSTTGRYTWPKTIDGLTFKCFYAIDATGVENDVSTDYKCGSLAGVAEPLDTTPAVLSNGQPTAALPAGTTTWPVSVTVNKSSVECRNDSTDIAYSEMTNQMTMTGLTASWNATGLTNGSNTPFYIRCNFTNTIFDEYPNTSSLLVTVLVNAPSDLTPPVRSAGSPNGILASGTTSVSMALLTNENATCKYGTTASVAYASIANTFATTGTTTHSQTISVSDGNTYTYYVRCQDGIPNANTDDFVITWSVTATPAPPDITPPVRSAGAPSGTLAAGTTSTSMTLTTDENATCKYALVAGVAYASMPTTFTTTGTTSHSVSVTGLTDNTTFTRYIRCTDVAGNANTTDFVITWFVAIAAGDTTAPSTVTNLVATTIGSSQAGLTWTPATDNVAVKEYQIYEASGACSTYALIDTIQHPTVTATIGSLVPSTAYCFTVLSVDTSANPAAAVSNVATMTTAATPDVTPPSNMTNLRLMGTFTNSILMTWDQGTDSQGQVTATIEMCTPTPCSNYTIIANSLMGNILFVQLAPTTSYAFRGYFNDQALNRSVADSNVLEVTTSTTGLPQPRPPAVGRSSSGTRSASPTRPPG